MHKHDTLLSAEDMGSLYRGLEKLNDRQLAQLSLRKTGMAMPVALHVERKTQGKTVDFGLPAGLVKDGDNYYLQQIAVVRVNSPEYVNAARRIVRKSTRIAAAVGIGIGILGAAVVMFAWEAWRQAQIDAIGAVSAPCLISRITPTAVYCRMGDKDEIISKGKFFPGGLYRLEYVMPERNGFSVVRIKDQRSIVFQADPKFFTQQEKQK